MSLKFECHNNYYYYYHSNKACSYFYRFHSGLKLKKMLKISCITFGFLGLIVGSVMGYLQMNEDTAAVQVRVAEIKNGTSNQSRRR